MSLDHSEFYSLLSRTRLIALVVYTCTFAQMLIIYFSFKYSTHCVGGEVFVAVVICFHIQVFIKHIEKYNFVFNK